MFFENAWSVALSLSFWLLLGAVAAGLLRVFVPRDFIARHLGRGRGFSGILKAVALGVPMPLCSCGVIPAALGIKRQGAGDGAAMGFLISTPQTGVDSVMVSASLLGFPFALFKLASAFAIGVVGGVWASLVGGGERDASPETGAAADHAGSVAESGAGRLGLRAAAEFAVDDLLKSIWKWLLAGILVSAAISTWLPPDFLKTHMPEGRILPMLAVLAVSLPMYVCATASVPIAAALVSAGMPTGAALVFLMAGPASNVATIGAVYKTFGLRKLLVYLISIIAGSMIGGYFFDAVVAASLPDSMVLADKEPSLLKVGAAFVLLALFARFAWIELASGFRGFRGSAADTSEQLTLRIVGLSCAGCAAKLRAALERLEGVSEVDIDLKTGETTLRGNGIDRAELEKTVSETGYGVER